MKELFEMTEEIHNYVRGRTILGVKTTKKLTDSGNKYKWTHGTVLTLKYDGYEMEFSVINYYDDSNSYNSGKDLLVDTIYNYKFKKGSKKIGTYQEIFTFIRGKLRKIKIHKVLNSK